MNETIEVAVFPVAGLGTRFLPATKTAPKEMLPIVDKPIIHYVVQEAINAGIKQLIFITSSSKRAIEDYFDTNKELEFLLESQEKFQALRLVKDILPAEVSFSYVRQPKPAGLGDAVLCARNIVGDRPFAVLLADDVIDSQENCIASMIDVFKRTLSTVLAIENVPKSETNKYGIVSLDNETITGAPRIVSIIEKPPIELAPSTCASIGRYIFTPKIFYHLEKIEKGAGGEYQLTDAIASLLNDEYVSAYTIGGKRYDCGSKIGFLKATIDFALKRSDLSSDLKRYLLEEIVLATTT